MGIVKIRRATIPILSMREVDVYHAETKIFAPFKIGYVLLSFQ